MTRTIPTGSLTCAESSAMDRNSTAVRSRILIVSVFMPGAGARSDCTSASIGRSEDDARVRPPVTAYGRTA